jgi:hypothetical protein
MSTSGVVAFQKDGELKAVYNHWDSYPKVLGNEVLRFLRETDVGVITTIFDVMISSDQEVTNFYDFIDFTTSLNDVFYYEDVTDLMYNSLWCEWAYIINLDDYQLEVYKGYSKEKPAGRFADIKLEGTDFYPVTLLHVYNFKELPKKFNSNKAEDLDAQYAFIELDLDDVAIDFLKKEARAKEMSVDHLIENIIKEAIKED